MTVEELSRQELKYAVQPAQLDAILRMLKPYCAPDGFYAPEKRGWYTVDTLYFDTPDWRIFEAAENQVLVRTKLRVRTYPDFPGSAAKIEIKRRIADKIVKTGAVVKGENWSDWLLAGADYSDLKPRARTAINDFITLQRSMNAAPKILIRYRRAAHRSMVDDYVRVTFDRAMEYQPMDRYQLAGDARRWRPIDDETAMDGRGHLLMELKFKERPPVWLAEIVLRLGLIRRGFSKYGSAVRRERAGLRSQWDAVAA